MAYRIVGLGGDREREGRNEEKEKEERRESVFGKEVWKKKEKQERTKRFSYFLSTTVSPCIIASTTFNIQHSPPSPPLPPSIPPSPK
jgi:hypothetical protein